jgi:S1-C subfamily serine protease
MDERYEGLLLRANRAFGGRPVGEAVAKVRAIVGVPQIPDAEVAAQAAWDKLRCGKIPSAPELAALEFVIRMMRPAPLSQKGELASLPSVAGTSTYNPDITMLWADFRLKVKPLLYSIGRLDRAEGPDPEVGTGFLVGGDLVLTNRHVVSDLSMGADELEKGQAFITFYQEAGTTDPPQNRFPITAVVALHPSLELALIRVELPAPRPQPQFETSPAAKATDVAAIGYPLKDVRNPLFVDAVFGSKYGVKRAALGEITGVSGQRLFHDCSTLGGNSGSPVFSLASARVVGVHYTGRFMYRNEAVTAAEAAQFVARAN